MAKIKNTWTRGEQAELARRAGISLSYLCRILQRQQAPRFATATQLAEACIALRIPLRFGDWINPAGSDSPLFAVV